MKSFVTLLFTFLLSTTVFSQWQQTNGPEGGAAYAIEKINGVYWVATQGGLYQSFDDGNNWLLSDQFSAAEPITSIEVIDGEIFMLAYKYDVAGTSWAPSLYRSNDNGGSWSYQDLSSLLFSWDPLPADFFKIDDNLFIWMDGDLIKSEDNGATWTSLTALFPDYASQISADGENILLATYFELYLSDDQGESWEFIDSLGSQSAVILNGDNILVEGYDQLHISSDLGNTWTQAPLPENAFYGEIIRSETGKLYALGSVLYTSVDNGITWNSLNQAYDIAPNDIIEESNGELTFTTANKGVYRTSQNGSIWAPLGNGLKASAIYYIHASPAGEVFVQSDAGNFRSTNGGITWLPWQKPEEYSYFHWIEWKGDTAYVLSGYNLYISTDNMLTYQKITPDGLLSDAQSLTFYDGRIYIPTGYNDQVIFTENGGATWDNLNLPSGNLGFDHLEIINDVFLLVSDEGEVFRSVDGGQNWVLVLEYWAPGVNYNRIYRFDNRLIIADNDGWWYSTNDGATWTSYIPTGMPVADQWDDAPTPTQIIQVGNLLFATLSFKGVYVSSDLGMTWQATNQGLNNLRSRRLAASNGNLYLGTSTTGVWKRGADFQSFSGHTYRDENGNGLMDAGELPMPNIIIEAKPLNVYSTSFQDGSYTVFAENLNDTIRAIPPSPYATVTPPYYIASQVGSDKDFGIYLQPNMNDLCITATETEPFRPGFDNLVNITVSNVGTTYLAPSVWLVLPAGVNFLSAAPAPNSTSGDTIFWDLETLPSFASSTISLEVNLDASVPIGAELYFLSFVAPVANDQNPVNNSNRLVSTVVGSFDPNDKRVSPEVLTPQQLTEQNNTLTYTIRFQNTGTFYAENVTIIDTLSESLDIASFQVLSSSHQPMNWHLRDGRVLEFDFTGIFLPDSTTSQALSHGFVKFSIRTVSSLKLNDQVNNTADIYFDFNAPIHTNDATMVVSNVSFVKEKQPQSELAVWPNPNDGIFNLELSSTYTGLGRLNLINVKGQTVKTIDVSISNGKAHVDAQNLAAGQYLARLQLNEDMFTAKVRVIK